MITRVATALASAMLMISTAAQAAPLKIYESASTKSPLVAKVQPGTKLIQIYQTKDNKWLKVGDPRDGRVGWVEANTLDNNTPNTTNNHNSFATKPSNSQPQTAANKNHRQPYRTNNFQQNANSVQQEFAQLRQQSENAQQQVNQFQHHLNHQRQTPQQFQQQQQQPQMFHQSWTERSNTPNQGQRFQSFQYQGTENLNQDQVREMFRQLRMQQIHVEAAVQALFHDMTSFQMRAFNPQQFFGDDFDGPARTYPQQQSMNQQFGTNQAYMIVPEQKQPQAQQQKKPEQQRHWQRTSQNNQHKRHNVFNTSRQTRPSNKHTRPQA